VKLAPVLFEKEQPSGLEYNLCKYKKVINEESSPSEASDQCEECSSIDATMCFTLLADDSTLLQVPWARFGIR
jgi:hypothetical protein